MNKLEALKALGIELPKEIFECEISFKTNPREEKIEAKIEGSNIAIRLGLLTIIDDLIKNGLFKDVEEIRNDYNNIFKEEEKKNDK